MAQPDAAMAVGIGFEASGTFRGLFVCPRPKRGAMPAAVTSVLTVEDDPLVRADLKLVLEDAGFAVVADAGDGLAAIELARRHRPDVILIDLGLPLLDGVQATRQILAERDVPIVALTGRARWFAEDAIDAGVSAYVLKPFAGDEVVAALHNALADHADAEVDDPRAVSLRALEELVSTLGYPVEWAATLEEQAWQRGHVWRFGGSGKRSDSR
jgi:response regulator NasT